MKKRIVKSFAFALSGLMIMSSVAPTFAYDLDSNNNSIESVEYQNTNDEDYSNQTNVFAELSSEYKVTIPKTIVLSGTTKKADYYVKVDGDIAGYETVNVVPDSTVNLYTKNKDVQVGTITQDKTSWQFDNFDINANGTVEASSLTAGKWSGTFNFNIYMDSHEDNNTNDPTQTVVEKKLTVNTNGLAMDAGSSHTVHAYYDGKDVTNEIDWSSDNSKITVDKGVVMTSATAQVGDTATITASMSDDTSGLVAALDKMGIIAVASAEDGSDSVSFTVTIVDINFDDSDGNEIDNISILPGESKSIRAKIVPETTGTVVWSCTAPSGVTLQKKGNDVTIYVANDMPEGRVYNVIATYGDYSKTIELTIASAAKDNLSVSIEDGDALTVGDVKTVNVTTTDNSTPSNVTITSSDENVAKIVDDKIEAVGAGNATITISADGSTSKTINVAVEEAQSLEAGLYDANDNLIVNWNDMVKATGFDIEKNYKMGDWRTASFYFVAKKYPNVRKVVIPEGTTHIGDYTFYLCSSSESIEIESIIIPSSVNTIGQSAFQNCTALKSIIIPNQVTKLNSNTFGGCSSLEVVKLSNSLEHIENNVFGGCTSLKSIIIPSSVTSISTGAFSGCSSLETVKLPDSLEEYIGTRLFMNCISLKEIEIPNSVTTIGDYALYGCEQLKTIKIPDSVEYIGSYALNCKELESVIIMNPSIELKSGVFSKCEKIKEITFNGTKAQWEKAAEYNLTYGNITPNVTVHCTDGDGDYLLNIR